MPSPSSIKNTNENGTDLVSSLRQLRDCPYYWGPLGKDEASNMLSNQPVGAFLLRDSSDDRHFFALSFRMLDGTHHVRISYVGGLFGFDHINVNMRDPSILNLIHTTVTRSRNREVQFFVRSRNANEAPVPVNILYPISRNNVVHSLLHLSRSTIRKHVRLDHIDRLGIPTRLKDYLKDSQYLYEESDTPLPTIDVDHRPLPPPLPPATL